MRRLAYPTLPSARPAMIAACTGALLCCGIALPAEAVQRDTARATDPGVRMAEAVPSVRQAAEWYEEGRRLADAGRWEEALEVWRDGEEELADQGVQDPRIGTAFIEAVVRNEATELFDEASRILMWSLSGDPISASHE